jgi:hypothetical protein
MLTQNATQGHSGSFPLLQVNFIYFGLPGERVFSVTIKTSANKTRKKQKRGARAFAMTKQ